MQKRKTSRSIKLHPERRRTHGGYSYLTRGELPEDRNFIERYLTGVRQGLIRDLAESEEDLSTAQLILIDRIISKLGCVRCIEEFARTNGVIKGNRLTPSLAGNYLAYSNSIRLDLVVLGIERSKIKEPLDIQSYVKKKYGKEKKSGKK